MSDNLYDRDVLAWSQQQADLLRRLGRGERVNDIDWTNVAEEIEDVGLSQLHSVESFLTLMLVHLLKLHAFPDSQDAPHWRGEVVAFQRNLKRRFAPSMRQRLDLADLYTDAADQVRAQYPAADLPPACPFTLDRLLKAPLEDLLSEPPPPQSA
jgi:hypothetical protein